MVNMKLFKQTEFFLHFIEHTFITETHLLIVPHQ